MNITINRFGGGPTTLDAFADANGLELEVNERKLTQFTCIPFARFYAHFKKCEVMERGMLSSVIGNGDTPGEAIRDYCRKIQGTRVAVGAYSAQRRELDVPNELTFTGEP